MPRTESMGRLPIHLANELRKNVLNRIQGCLPIRLVKELLENALR